MSVEIMRRIARAEKLHKAATRDLRDGFPHTAKGRVLDMDLLAIYREVTRIRDSRPTGTRRIYDAGRTLRACYDLKDALKDGAPKDVVADAGRIVARLRELIEDAPEYRTKATDDRMGALLRGEA